jgi:hypothetical protein
MRAETLHAATAPLAGQLIDLYRRALRLVFKPGATFETIANAHESITSVMTRWVAPLVLITLAVKVLSAWIFGIDIKAEVNGESGSINRPFELLEAVKCTLPLLAQSIAMVFVTASIIHILAPAFRGTRNFVQAVRTAAYVATPAWLVGIFGAPWEMGVFQIRPPRDPALFIGAFWSIWLLVRALPSMMRVAAGKAWGYMAAVAVVMTILWLFALRITFQIMTRIYMGNINW